MDKKKFFMKLGKSQLLGGVLSIFIVFTLLTNLNSETTDLILVKDSKPSAQIVIDENASLVAKFAAQELQYYIEKISGAKLAIVETIDEEKANLIIGDHAVLERLNVDTKSLKYEEFIIRRFGNKIVFYGYDMLSKSRINVRSTQSVGSLYAVYDFLERELGVHWYYAGEFGEVVPRAKDISVKGEDIQDSPKYGNRFLNPYYTDDASDEDMNQWYLRIRMSFGKGVAIANHSHHKWGEWYGKSHPEYFALQPDGTRKTTEEHYPHLCYSCPGVLKQEMENIQSAINGKLTYIRQPTAKYIFVMPNDNSPMYLCQCPECKKQYTPERGGNGITSDYVWNYVSKVAEECKKLYPDRKVLCCAYEGYTLPPAKKLADNVQVTLCIRNDPYVYQFNSEKAWEKFEKDLKSWREKAKQFSIWHYPLELPYSCKGIYAVAPHIIQKINKRGYEYGARDAFFQMIDRNMSNRAKRDGKWSWANPAFQHLEALFIVRTLWNPDMDIDKFLQDYYYGFYGPAGKSMENFFTLMITSWENCPHYIQKTYDIYKYVYTDNVMRSLIGHLSDASKDAKSGIYSKRVEWIRNGFEGIKTTWEKRAAMKEKYK